MPSKAAYFKKKPLASMQVVTEAVRFDGENHESIIEWAGTTNWLVFSSPAGLIIRTLDGLVLASPGDWIIRGTKGEIYPCKPDVFAATYQRVASLKKP